MSRRLGAQRPMRVAVFVCCLMAALQAVAVIVSFPDARLESEIRWAINTPVGDIQDTDLAGLTFLATGSPAGAPWELTGLEYCTNLTLLAIWPNVLNLEPLRSLHKLTDLQLSVPINEAGYGNIRDISPIAECTSLHSLTFRRNCVSDVSAVEGMVDLVWLECDVNLIRDVGPLVRNAGLPSWAFVILDGNPLGREALCEQFPILRARGLQNLDFGDCANPEPQITGQPAGGVFHVGDSATLSVEVDFAPGWQYRGFIWTKDGLHWHYRTDVSSYTISPLQESNTGTYQCYVYDNRGSVVSGAVYIQVLPGEGEGEGEGEIAHIEASPAGWVEESAALTLTAIVPDFVGNVTYQWTKDGVPIPDKTSNAFHIHALTLDDSGWYGCQVTDESKAVHILPPVLIQVFPEGSLPVGGIAAFAALATLTCVLIALRILVRKRRTSSGRTI